MPYLLQQTMAHQKSIFIFEIPGEIRLAKRHYNRPF